MQDFTRTLSAKCVSSFLELGWLRRRLALLCQATPGTGESMASGVKQTISATY